MHTFEYILILLAAVLVSNFFSVWLPRVSTSLVQIALGVALTLVPFVSFEMHLEPELFVILFIAPLLFDDAKRMNKPSLWRLRYPVLFLALGLVFCTVLILGFAVNLFAPSIPLAAAFALAAALAPTDAVSVSSLKQNAHITSEQNRLLQGESLLNDASSIVSFNFAVAAAITGSFSALEAGGVFLVQFLGGLALGVVVMFLRYGLIRLLRASGMESISFHVLFEVITPFWVYLLAELVGVSGIIAVVAAGIAHSFEPRAITPSSARLGVVSSSIWSILSFTLNGLVFLILGTQLPYVIGRVWTSTDVNTNFLLLFLVLILLVVVVLRFIWILIMRRNVNLGQSSDTFDYEANLTSLYPTEDEDEALSMDFDEMNFAEREAAFEEHLAFQRQEYKRAQSERAQARKEARRASKQSAKNDERYWKLHLIDALVLSLSGAKGAITLAVILSVPLSLSSTEAFPERDLLIFLASGVILLSLLVANIFVPLIAPKKKQVLHEKAELQAIIGIYRSVITELSAASETEERSAVSTVVQQYYQRINKLKTNNSIRLPSESKVRRLVIDLELENTQRLTDNDKVSSFTAYYYIDILSHQLSRFEQHRTLGWEARAFVDQFVHRWKRRVRRYKAAKEEGGLMFMYDLHALQLANYRFAIKKLEELEPSEDYPAYTVDLIKKELEQRATRLESRWGRDGLGSPVLENMRSNHRLLVDVEARALDYERKAIQKAHEEGAISDETAKMLRDNVALMELDIEEQLD